MKPSLTAILLPLAAALSALAGCVNADTVDGPVEMTVYNIVTFEGNDPTARFTFQPQGDATALTLTAQQTVDTATAQAGMRVMLAYQTPDAARPGAITLKGVSRITQGALTGSKGEPRGWDTDGVWVESVWRSGAYIDMRLRLPYTDVARRFALMVDSATIAGGHPQLYLYHSLPEGVSPDSTYLKRYYASFLISSLWSRPETEDVTVNIANTSLTSKRSFIFKKNQP